MRGSSWAGGSSPPNSAQVVPPWWSSYDPLISTGDTQTHPVDNDQELPPITHTRLPSDDEVSLLRLPPSYHSQASIVPKYQVSGQMPRREPLIESPTAGNSVHGLKGKTIAIRCGHPVIKPIFPRNDQIIEEISNRSDDTVAWDAWPPLEASDAPVHAELDKDGDWSCSDGFIGLECQFKTLSTRVR
jgi:hypothetical protein